MIGRATAWAGASETCRLVAGLATFVLLARALGPAEFGRYAGALALIWTLMAVATLGRGQLLVMQVSREPGRFPAHWSAAITGVVLGGVSATFLLLALGPLLLSGLPLRILVTLGVSELVFTALSELSVSAALAHERLPLAAAVRINAAVIRLAAAAAFTLAGGRSLATFSTMQLAACMVGGGVGLTLASRRFGRPGPARRPTLRSLAQGLPFSFGSASEMMQDGFDKTVLVRSGFAVQAGAYAVAYRAVTLSMLPVTALLQATYARFFRAGADGLASAWSLGRRLLLPTLAYGAVVAAGALAAAPLLAAVLGSQYDTSVPMIRALAFLPLIRILQYFPANALTGSGYQKLRGICQASTAVLMVAVCFAVIPHLGWAGAVVATMVAEVTFGALMWTVLAVKIRAEGHADAPPAPAGVMPRAA